ncbi:hypothetical protein GCM10009654_50120 [Streptomyces hebeiensis]|uniref:Translation initiation factor IF-2 n=1 Tax=Streptomyces hebeiensis TaxID=229486 RepID=A0ABN1V0F5_9ACTN
MDQQNRSGGGSTPFEDMSHEDMLSWLDRADSGAVQGAADTLSAAAGEIREIAEQLKARPERVEWQGEGYKAFIEWSASLASATFRLAEYSDGASQWLGHASNAIAEAQSAIPRDVAGAKANLAAALNAPNDPDSGLVIGKSSSTLATDAERNRLEAATQMRRLANVYEHSQTQMGKLEVPTFQPPPTEFVPSATDRDSMQDLVRSGSGTDATVGSGGGQTHRGRGWSSTEGAVTPATYGNSLSPAQVIRPDVPVATEIASVDTQPPTTVTPTAPNVPPVVGRSEGSVLPMAPNVPPAFGRNGSPSQNLPHVGRTGGTRPPSLTGQAGPNAGPAARLPTERGITGGRPVPPASGRSGALPRGMIVGGESPVHGRPPMAHGVGGGLGGAPAQNGMTGRRLAGETGGIVGGRPQPGTSGRAFTPGGTGLVRNGATPPRVGKASKRRDETTGERPDYLVEDEETWQQSGRRIVPPVVD